ncbi:zinc finger protein [Colletotrichum camelliae]|nr:zinc finger protein [Colletotrichum camelliae]
MSRPSSNPPATTRNPFEEVLSRFKRDLKAKEKEYFKFATEEEFKKEVDALQTRLHSGRRQQNMTKLRGFIEAMAQFGKVIDVFCQTSEVVAFIWGPWKLLLLIGDAFSNAFAELLDTYEQLGDTMKLLLQTKPLFPNDAHMALVISGIYKDVLEFHRKAFQYFQQPMLKQLFQATWKTYKTNFSDLIHAMENHRILLIGQITLSEARRTREAEEARLMDLKMERELRIRRELYGWLHSANFKNDHHRFKMIRAAYPNTCRWLLSKREFRRWFDRFPSTIPALLWLNGIPGAGKTILSSMIVDEAQSLAEKPTVLFFYCRTDDPEKNTFISLARSLLHQLLEREENLLPFFYEKYKTSTEATLATISDAEELLEVAIKNTPSVYIVLDGIDECGREQRKAIVRWFRKLVEGLPQKSSDQVRCLFVSQDDGPARNDFAGIVAMKIHAEDNRQDIHEFSASWALKLQQKFELPGNETDQIATQITDTCHGMFLLARLICENLLEQSTYEDLRHELEPDVFPQEINDAYERIMCRVSSQITSKRKENYCLLILGWLVCSKRPLRWQEIQVMKSMDSDADNINMRQRCFRDQPKDICGSMVEECDDGVVDLVHQTAKLFLVDNNHVNPAIEELKLATLCVDYMNLPLNRLPLPDISTSILAGHCVFLEYAVLFWVRHLESGVLSPEIDELVLRRLTKSLSRFLDIHWTNMTSPLVVSERSKSGCFDSKAFELVWGDEVGGNCP